MLFDYTFLLKKFDTDFFEKKNVQISQFIIPINDEIKDKKLELFQILSKSNNCFCFYISPAVILDSKQFIKEEIILNLVRLFFLPNYIKVDGKFLVFIDKINEKESAFFNIYNEFYTELKKQGIIIDMIEIAEADSSLELIAGKHYSSIIKDDFNDYLNEGKGERNFESFSEIFTSPVQFNKKWVVPVTNFNDFEKKKKLIENFERWIISTEPKKVKFIEMYNVANRSNEKLKLENDLLKFKLKDCINDSEIVAKGKVFLTVESNNTDDQKYIAQLQLQISAEQKRASEILEWYKKEYELLPMWYKKLGHLIKVILGKREFKSLFKQKNIK